MDEMVINALMGKDDVPKKKTLRSVVGRVNFYLRRIFSQNRIILNFRFTDRTEIYLMLSYSTFKAIHRVFDEINEQLKKNDRGV